MERKLKETILYAARVFMSILMLTNGNMKINLVCYLNICYILNSHLV